LIPLITEGEFVGAYKVESNTRTYHQQFLKMAIILLQLNRLRNFFAFNDRALA